MAPGSRLSRFDAALRSGRGAEVLVGVDEAGRGPLAGPVVAAAVVFPPRPPRELEGVKDSKMLSPSRRAALFDAIRSRAVRTAVGWATPEEIDRRNILQATFSAMRRALARLGLDPSKPILVAVDGNLDIPGIAYPQLALIHGDARSQSIAGASILAKVVRDRWMDRIEALHPGYGFSRHKGYGTAAHLEALGRLGPCPVHRRSFAPVSQAALPLGAFR